VTQQAMPVEQTPDKQKTSYWKHLFFHSQHFKF